MLILLVLFSKLLTVWLPNSKYRYKKQNKFIFMFTQHVSNVLTYVVFEDAAQMACNFLHAIRLHSSHTC